MSSIYGWSADEDVPTPDLAAARLVLWLVAVERLPWWAARWIADGHDGDGLRALAGLDASDPREIRDALRRAFDDMDVSPPETDLAAARLVFRDVAGLFLSGVMAEGQVVRTVETVLSRTGYPADIMDLPLGRLEGMADEWEEGWGRSREELAPLIRRQCAAQLL